MADWPQWRGPLRNGLSSEKLGPGAPKKLWSVAVGEGFSSVAVVGGKLYTVGNAQNSDTVLCLDAATGRTLWKFRYNQGAGDYGGPRATPTVHNGNVYTLSREGLALCLNAASGKLVWQRAIPAQIPTWGLASSPLILGNRVIYNVGGAGTALDKTTGKLLWTSGGVAGYASPVPFAAGGQSGVALFVSNALIALNPATGQRLWQHPWQTQYDVNAADPIFSGDTVFISSNYGRGGALLKLAGGRPSVVWENRSMKNHFNTSVLLGGALYGNDENTLRCLDHATGRERWNLRGIDKGGLIAADGRLLVLSGRGELIIARADASRYTELSRTKILDGTCWTHPVLANGIAYCRSHEGTLAAVSLRG